MLRPPVNMKGTQVDSFGLEMFEWVDTKLVQYVGTGDNFIELNKYAALNVQNSSGHQPPPTIGVNHLNALIISKIVEDDICTFDMNVICPNRNQEHITHGLWRDDLVLVQVNDEG